MAGQLSEPRSDSNTFSPGSAFANFLNEPALRARRYNVANGQVVHDVGDVADRVRFVQRGQIRLFQVDAAGNSRLCDVLGPGQWFGAAAIARQSTYGLRAVAVGMTVLTEVAIDPLLDGLSKRADLLIELNRQLAAKVTAVLNDAAELIFSDTTARLINAMLRFSGTAAGMRREDGCVVLNMTHSHLAQAVGAARETVSLALTQLRHQHLVETGRNRLTFNPAELAKFRDGMRIPPSVNRVA